MNDQVAQPLVQRHEIGLEGHGDGARTGEIHRAVVDDAAGPRTHHADTAGQEAGLTQVMRDQQHGRPVRHPQILHDRPEFLAGELVERSEGLVEQQQARFMDQGAAEIGALQHPARQLPGIMLAESLEPDLIEQGISLVAERTATLAAILRTIGLDDLERQHDVLLDRHPGQHGRILEGHADAQRLGRHFATPNDHGARGRLHQTADQFQDGRLAAA